MILAAMLLAAEPRPPAPLGNPGAWISDEDYPPDAVRETKSGTVEFALDVSADGRITSCFVTASSGSASLDAATCQLITTRATFSPARDRRGRKVAGQYRNRVVWRIPNEAPELPLKSWSETLQTTISASGALSSCNMTARGSGFPTGRDGCALLAQWPPAMLLAIRSTPGSAALPVAFQTSLVLDGDEFPSDYIGADLTQTGLGSVHFEVAADGTTGKCELVKSEGVVGLMLANMCGMTDKMKFDVTNTDSARPFPRNGTYLMATAVKQTAPSKP